MAERISYTAGIAQARLVLGTIAYHTGENQAAIQYILPSIALWRELERPFDLATALNRLAGALAELTTMPQLNQHKRNAGISTNP
jgi:hypothetical protein